jgi:hypothetical protein
MKQPESIRTSTGPSGEIPDSPDAVVVTTAGGADSAGKPTAMAGPTMRTWLSLWVSVHLLAILVSFTGVVEPSTIHARLSELAHPYLRPTHFAADDRPVYLAYGDSFEQPHRLQVTTSIVTDIASVDALRWQAVGPDGGPGLAVSDRVARWLSTAAMLAENEQPGLVAELLLPVAQHDPRIRAIRIVRFPTDLSDINEEAESPYVARVVRDGDFVSLVQLRPARLSSQALQRPRDQPNE